nr:hypothetical protein [uncultured Cetobacterium sp.]
MIKKIFIIMLIITSAVISAEGEDSSNSIPMIPMIPATPIEKEEDVDGVVKIRPLLKVGAAVAKIQAEVVVPLEVISDVDIKALVVDDENLEIPFELELSRKPEAENMYKLNFSSTKIDIDNDGKIDTEIFASEKINDTTIRDNYVKITGKNISKEGTHKKRVYITVEVRD